MWQDIEVIADMLHATERIQLFVLGMSQEQFLADEKTQAAVQYQLLILGEAAKRVSLNSREHAPQIPWSPIARMRDKLIHAYQIADMREVWRTAVKDVPVLHRQLEDLLDRLS